MAWRLYKKLGWPPARLFYELENGLPYRTFPPGHVIPWSNPYVQAHFLLPTSELFNCAAEGRGKGARILTLTVEFWDGERPPAPPSPKNAPAATPESKNVSPAELKRVMKDIGKEYPPGTRSPSEEKLNNEVDNRLKRHVSLARVKEARDEHAPHLKLEPGRPRKARDK